MKFKGLVFAGTMLIGLGFSSMSFADDAAMKTMAKIMINLNHYPSDGEKSQLMEITKNNMISENEKVLASAMINLQHHAAAADIPKLKSVASNEKASQAEKDLANIILSLTHTPTSADKAKLEKILN